MPCYNVFATRNHSYSSSRQGLPVATKTSKPDCYQQSGFLFNSFAVIFKVVCSSYIFLLNISILSLVWSDISLV